MIHTWLFRSVWKGFLHFTTFLVALSVFEGDADEAEGAGPRQLTPCREEEVHVVQGLRCVVGPQGLRSAVSGCGGVRGSRGGATRRKGYMKPQHLLEGGEVYRQLEPLT